MALPIYEKDVKKNSLISEGNERVISRVGESYITAEMLIDPKNNWKALVPLAYQEAEDLREKISSDDKNLTEDISEARLKGRSYEKYKSVRAAVFQRAHTRISSDIKYSQYSKERNILVDMVTNEIIGLGPMEPLWTDKGISEIMIDGPNYTRIEKNGRKIEVPNCIFYNQEHLESICQQIVEPLNRRIDKAQPIVDARLPDLSRVNIVHPIIAFDGPIVTIRRHRESPWTMEQFIENGTIDAEMARDLSHWVAEGCSTIVIGGTGSGKTSILSAMAGQIPKGTRVIVIEDNRELDLPIHAIYEESRLAGTSGKGEITLNDLVVNSLRQKPDRIIVGEARTGMAAMSLLDAMSTGHNGSISTIHANHYKAGISRLVNMIQRDMQQDKETILGTLVDAVDLFVTVSLFKEDGTRKVTGIYEIPDEITYVNGNPTLVPIPLWEYVVDNIDRTPGHEKVYGHFEKKNDLSDQVKYNYRISEHNKPSLEEVIQRSNGNWG